MVESVQFCAILPSAIDRILQIKKKYPEDKFLRVAVSSGGCNGFQYSFDLVNDAKPDDIKIYHEDKLICVIDEISSQFLEGSSIEFVTELGGSFFKINNPNSKVNCGCGNSFGV